MTARRWFSVIASTASQLRALALFEILQTEEKHRSIRRVGEAVDRKPGEGHHIDHAGRLARDARDLVHDAIGALQRGTIGQLDETDEILLVEIVLSQFSLRLRKLLSLQTLTLLSLN